MEREVWRKNWLLCLNKLTDIELQKQAWLDKTNTNRHWTFIEFIDSYFNDLSIEKKYEFPLQKGWLTKQEYETLKKWHDLLDNYQPPGNDDYNHEEILNDKNWHFVVQKGKNAIKTLLKNLNKDEAKILSDMIDYQKFKKKSHQKKNQNQ